MEHQLKLIARKRHLEISWNARYRPPLQLNETLITIRTTSNLFAKITNLPPGGPIYTERQYQSLVM